MNEVEKTIKFSQEYLKGKDLLAEMQTAIQYCLTNSLITQEQVDKATQEGRTAMMSLGNQALSMYLRQLYQQQSQQ